MNRYRWSAVLLVVLLALIGVGWVVGTAEEVPDRTAEVVRNETLSPPRLVPADTPVVAAESDPADTIQVAKAGSGWPFEELPLVIKSGLPTPQVSLLPAPSRSLYEHALVRPVRSQPVVAARDVSPLWLLGPLAAGAAIGGADAGPISVPEPSLLLLVSTGLLIIGIRVIRRG